MSVGGNRGTGDQKIGLLMMVVNGERNRENDCKREKKQEKRGDGDKELTEVNKNVPRRAGANSKSSYFKLFLG